MFYSDYSLKRHKKSYVYIALLPMLILLGLKGSTIGSDTINYIRIYDNALGADILGALSMNEDLEWGFKMFIHILTRITTNYQWQFIIVGLLVYISVAQFILKHAKDPVLTILLFLTLGYFQFSMSGIRQTIAMSIILFAYEALKNKTLIRYLLIVFLAFLFHKSALFFLPAYFIANNSFNRKNILFIFIATTVFLLFIPNIILWSADFLEYNYGIEETSNGYIFFTIILIITLLSFVYNKRFLQDDPKNIVFLNINIISFLLWCARLVSRTAERVSFYFLPASCIMLEEYVATISQLKFKREVYFFVVVLCAVFFIYRIYNNPSLYPYHFCSL